jgi:hypothetical protein
LPDDTPEKVLEIEGQELPPFVHNPQGHGEIIAAAALKADHNPKERKARRKKGPSPDSVHAWVKECALIRPGRSTWSDDATASYKQYCEDRNLTPVSNRAFGTILANELGIRKTKSNGRVKYHDFGLRPALRVVSA